jgi:hypothetical protein
MALHAVCLWGICTACMSGCPRNTSYHALADLQYSQLLDITMQELDITMQERSYHIRTDSEN